MTLVLKILKVILLSIILFVIYRFFNSTRDDSISERTVQSVLVSNKLDFKEIYPVSWDKVCFIGPYFGDDDDSMKKHIGVSLEGKCGYTRHDDRYFCLVFIRNKKIIAWTEVPSDKVDIPSDYKDCYLPEEAKFERRVSVSTIPTFYPVSSFTH